MYIVYVVEQNYYLKKKNIFKKKTEFLNKLLVTIYFPMSSANTFTILLPSPFSSSFFLKKKHPLLILNKYQLEPFYENHTN